MGLSSPAWTLILVSYASRVHPHSSALHITKPITMILNNLKREATLINTVMILRLPWEIKMKRIFSKIFYAATNSSRKYIG